MENTKFCPVIAATEAVGMLIAEGKTEYEFLPCSVEQIEDTDRSVREQVLLIAANSQREKTAWDKLEEVRQMRNLQRQAKAERGLNGRVRPIRWHAGLIPVQSRVSKV